MRETINSIDEQLVKLFVRRMETVEDVARYKLSHGLAVLDAGRETVVLDRVSALAGDEMADSARRLYICLMGLSRERQEALIARWRTEETH